MKILVTGGAGFLGSHVVDALENAGHEVTIFDSMLSPYASSSVRSIVGDITDCNIVDDAVGGHDVIYHFAGISGIEDCRLNPRVAIDVNIGGTVNVLESCVRHNISRFVFASTAYVFSKYGYIYKTTKITCENLIRDFFDIYGLHYTNLRFGSLYGRRADRRNSIYRMLQDAALKGKIVYKGTGDEVREYIHVHDAALIAVKILEKEYINRDIIITGNEKFKYSEILEMIKEIMNKEIEICIEEREDACHYILTPYTYKREVGTKLTSSEFIDFGQGILDCLDDIESRNREDD